MRIGIIGKGHVGTALGTGLERAGHEVKYGRRDPNENVSDAATFGEVLILAVPFSQMKNAAEEIGDAGNGKTIMDVTKATNPKGGLAIGFTTSAAEELQSLMPGARVVKAFNYVFAKNQSTGKVKGKSLTAFVAGDDQESKKAVMNLARDIGFRAVDAGSLQEARYLEPLGMLLMDLAFKTGLGTDIGFELIA